MGSNFNQLYVAVLSQQKLLQIAGMTTLLAALRQLNFESKDIFKTKSR